MKKLLVLTLSLLLVVAMLFGCGAKSESMVGNSAAPDRFYGGGAGGDADVCQECFHIAGITPENVLTQIEQEIGSPFFSGGDII